jgi:hypothetical protein
MPVAVQSKKCTRCKQLDQTDFSSCRFCGTRYDAVIQVGKVRGEGFGAKLRSVPFLICFLLAVILIRPLINHAVIALFAR